MKKVKVSHKGRKCKHPGCKITLSIYNHECYCYVHQNKADFHMDIKSKNEPVLLT